MKKVFLKILILLGLCVSHSIYAQDDIEYLAPYVFEEVVIDDSDVEYLAPYVLEGALVDSSEEYLAPYNFDEL